MLSLKWFYNSYNRVKTKSTKLDKNLIKKYLDKILQSGYFNKSKVSCDLLEYLVKASLEGNNPKEFTIGVELFGKKYDNRTKQDSNIRVYIHNIRKKLKEYYENEGSRDEIIFELERGKYIVNFKTRKEIASEKPKSYLVSFLLTLGLLIMVSVFYFLKTKKEASPWKRLPVWQNFADNRKETLLVLGDYYVFNGLLPTGNSGIYRDFFINSEVDYEHLLDKKPELVKTLSKSNLTYLSKMAIFCESDIYKVFARTGGTINVKLLSDIQPTDLKQYNIIFIGNYKNMGIFENMVHEMKFAFGVANSSIQYIFANDPCARIYEASGNNLKEEDFALIVNTNGYNGNRLLLFLSSQDIGNIASVKQMTNSAYLKQFTTDKLKNLDPENFHALYKVEGINKTDLSINLIRVE